jgi:hypothetical protein
METGHTKRTTSHGFHFVVSLFTVGLWVIPWIAIGILNMAPAKCARCGSSYSQALAVKTAAHLDTQRRLGQGESAVPRDGRTLGR